jgi:rubrerythrin
VAIQFSIKEIVDIGIQIEENGETFYKIVSDKIKSDKAKDIFIFLANEEIKHVEMFKSIANEVEANQKDDGEYNEDYFSYVKALASEHLFTSKGQGEILAQKVSTDIEAIEIGINFEKDSIIFYQEMSKMVKDNDLKILNKVIEQEKSHLTKLTSIKQYLLQ